MSGLQILPTPRAASLRQHQNGGWWVARIKMQSYAWQMAATLILTATAAAGLAMIASP